jgi:peptide chain release factor 1
MKVSIFVEMEKFFLKLDAKREELKKLEEELSSSELISDRLKYKSKTKEYSELREIVEEYDQYLNLEREKDSLEKLISEEKVKSEYSVLAQMELVEITQAIEAKIRAIEDMVLSEDLSSSKKNVIMEIRAGTGGKEAGLFAQDLFKMYSRFADSKGWKISVLSLNASELGGLKEIIFSVEGTNVFKHMRFEMGTHRVQRVPETEASGRIHTSAATVAVLPEPDDVEVDIKPQDLKIDYYRAAGAGGQHVNTTDSAVRITHLPTGVVVSCQDERSQHKNKAKAMRVLKARILESVEQQQHDDRSEQRKKQVGTGDRSEKIRTYNFPENRITDHRVNLTLYKLADIMDGELEDLIEGLQEADRRLKLEDCDPGAGE